MNVQTQDSYTLLARDVSAGKCSPDEMQERLDRIQNPTPEARIKSMLLTFGAELSQKGIGPVTVTVAYDGQTHGVEVAAPGTSFND